MSHFRPTRASPRLKPINVPDPTPRTLPADMSQSSISSAPELLALSQHEIELIDAVIARAGPSATTFLTVFKAYNDVLNERGLDPHEVLYYGKLLKLGTMKGHSWGAKWDVVKRQYNHQGSLGDSESNNQSHGQIQARQIQAPNSDLKNASKPRVVRRRNAPRQFDDTFTLHSHGTESDVSSTAENDENENETYVPRFTTKATTAHQPSWKPPSRSDDTRTDSPTPTHPRTIPTPKFRQKAPVEKEFEGSDYSEIAPSPTPPSYNAAIYDKRSIERPRRLPPNSRVQEQSTPVVTSAIARKALAAARERRGSVVNDEDAWKKIKMQRDEADADQFRADRLQERCWEVWKQGLEWILVRFDAFWVRFQLLLIYLPRRPTGKLGRPVKT